MEGFRFLQVGERVTYELEVGEKGMKAVSDALLEPRAARPSRDDDFGGNGGDQGGYDDRDDRDAGYPPRREQRAPRPAPRREERPAGGNDKAGRKLERLISLLVEKGVLAPGEIDGLEQAAGAPAANA